MLGLGRDYDTQISDEELVKFNGKFEVYDRKDNTYLDIITVCNLAYDVNKRYDYDEQNSVVIRLYLTNSPNPTYSILSNKNLKKNYFFVGETTSSQKYMYDDLAKTYTNQINGKYEYRFECTKMTYNETTGKVNSMNFKVQKN